MRAATPGTRTILLIAAMASASLTAFGLCYVMAYNGECGVEQMATYPDCLEVVCDEKREARLIGYETSGTDDYTSLFCGCEGTVYEHVNGECGGLGTPVVPDPPLGGTDYTHAPSGQACSAGG